jgi:hypothetical protein
MHRIVKSHLESFTKSFGVEQLDESMQFEMFANYAVLRSRIGSDFDIEDVTTGPGDDGTDGVSIIINEEVIVSDEDAKSIFSSDKKNNDVEALFIQAKRGDSFDLGDFLKFKESVLRFVASENYSATDDIQINARNIFDVAIENVPKIRGGKPDLTARFVTTGVYRAPAALESALKDFKAQIE